MALAYDERGSGAPLVLLHAGIGDRSMWAEHLDPLAAAGHRVVAFDLPGFGDSPLPAGELAEWLEVLAAMDALGIERAAIAGNSFGAAVAMRVALVAPDRVSALMAVSAVSPEAEADPSPQLAAAWEAEESALEAGDTEAAVAAVVAAWTLPDGPVQLRERVAAMQRRNFANAAAAPEPERAADPLEDDPGALARIAVPALVCAGERDMPDCIAGARAMAAAMPAARHAIIPGAGHLAPLEEAEAFRGLLLGLIDDRE